MKLLLILMVCLTFYSCDKKPDQGSSLPDGADPAMFGKCVSNEEAAALGVDKKCSEPGCVCLQDVHSNEPRLYPHCHSSADKCD